MTSVASHEQGQLLSWVLSHILSENFTARGPHPAFSPSMSGPRQVNCDMRESTASLKDKPKIWHPRRDNNSQLVKGNWETKWSSPVMSYFLVSLHVTLLNHHWSSLLLANSFHQLGVSWDLRSSTSSQPRADNARAMFNSSVIMRRCIIYVLLGSPLTSWCCASVQLCPDVGDARQHRVILLGLVFDAWLMCASLYINLQINLL